MQTALHFRFSADDDAPGPAPRPVLWRPMTPVAPPSPAATLADWLHLHAVTAEDLRPWLDPAPAPAAPAADPALAPPLAPALVTDALAHALPPLFPVLAQVNARVRFDLAPDPVRYPRAFTLADDGTGNPFISCPTKGRISDILTLAHEIGHACQIMATGPIPLPPIQRETAAFLAEHAVARALAATHPGLIPRLASRHARIMRHDTALRAALAAPATPYAYGWNYPVALRLAARATAILPAGAVAGLITSPGPLAPLLLRLNPG